MLGMAAAGLCFCERMVRPHTDDGTTKGKHGEARQGNAQPNKCSASPTCE